MTPTAIRLSSVEDQLLTAAAARASKSKTQLIRDAIHAVVRGELDAQRADALHADMRDIAARQSNEHMQLAREFAALREQVARVVQLATRLKA